MRGYAAIVSARFRTLLQYRAAAVAGFGTQLVFGLIHAMVLGAFYAVSTRPQPMTYTEVVAYVWLGQAMLGMLPVMLMVVFMLNVAMLSASSVEDRLQRQEGFDRLVSIADYTVKSGAVYRSDGVRHPNWLDESLLTEEYTEGLRQRASLDSLYISLHEPEHAYPACIYRLVVTGDERAISRLHVCGG